MVEEISIRSVKKCGTGETVFEMKNDGEILVGNSKELIKEITEWMYQRQKSLQSR
jgi:hypothetical protein